MTAPPVLLIHGFGSSYEHGWRHPGWVDLLQDAGRRVIGVDLLGHGGADKPHDPAAYSDVEGRVAAEIAAEESVDVVGFSAGAQVALRLMAGDPERFRRGAVLGIGDAVLSGGGPNRIAEALERGPDPEEVESVVFQRLAEQPGNDREALIAFLRRSSPPLACDDLARITCPVLVVIGDRDFNYPAGHLVSALGDARLVTLRGVDHFATTTDFGAMEAVLSFLATTRV
jgi:pimeloyl-ACP methyl ester carboxylesterase